MFDYKLYVFLTVATRLSFSKATEELHITQPAITRHIQQMEGHFGQKLFERKGNSIELTKAGEVLMGHAQGIFRLHKALDYDMNALIDKTEGELRIAASTTIAQYLLPEVLAKFHKKFPKIKLTLLSANTENVERYVLQQQVEIGFIEGQSKNRELYYQSFLKDEIVLVVAKGHSLYNASSITLETLKNLPLVLREEGSGALEFILHALRANGISEVDLKIEMRLGSSESIKSYLKDGQSVAFISINTIVDELKSGELGIVDVDDFKIDRYFSYIHKQGHHSPLSQLFFNYVQYHYNLKL
jgi:DNA-binding transcriptional LysR family regulator